MGVPMQRVDELLKLVSLDVVVAHPPPGRRLARRLDAASAADRPMADVTPGGGLVKALNPTVVIELQEVLTGSTRAVRIRDLTTPSWLSIRTGPS